MTPEDRVIACFARLLGMRPADIKMQSTLDELGMDSLDVLETIMALEDEFEIDISEDETAAFNTVGEFAALVKKQVAGTINGYPV